MPEHTLASIFLMVDLFWVAMFFVCMLTKTKSRMTVLFIMLNFLIGAFVAYIFIFSNLVHTCRLDRQAKLTPSQLESVVSGILK